jgi:hypothetical protein
MKPNRREIKTGSATVNFGPVSFGQSPAQWNTNEAGRRKKAKKGKVTTNTDREKSKGKPPESVRNHSVGKIPYLRRIEVQRTLDAGRHSGQDGSDVAFESFRSAVDQRDDSIPKR